MSYHIIYHVILYYVETLSSTESSTGEPTGFRRKRLRETVSHDVVQIQEHLTSSLITNMCFAQIIPSPPP